MRPQRTNASARTASREKILRQREIRRRGHLQVVLASFDQRVRDAYERPLIGATGYDQSQPLDAYPHDGTDPVMDADVIWSCTTCGACVEQCPVDIEHVDHIVDMRRYQVLIESAFPSELGGLFKNLEQNANPWGMNPRLRLAIEKAKAVNLPADTVKRNIDKATGNLEGVHYEEIRYEGYGIGGAAIIVDTMTDNRVRTVAEVRHAFSKHGGNLGTDGSVAFQFKHCGQFVFAPGTSEDRVMEVALEAVQLFGGNGYMAEYQVEQLARDAKVLQIYGGTDEIQVSQIARSLLA